MEDEQTRFIEIDEQVKIIHKIDEHIKFFS